MNFLKKLFYLEIQSELRGCRRILDLGCGDSSILEKLDRRIFYSVGVDAYKPYIEESKKKGAHDEYVMGNILTVDFPEKSFDAIICFELIEHFEREDALNLVGKMVKWASKKIIITTPNGFIPQGESDGNDLQEHKSGWTSQDLRRLGFRVRGLQGFKILARRENPVINFLWHLSFPLVFFVPSLSWRLLAIKTMK